jgi:hypothetical protein
MVQFLWISAVGFFFVLGGPSSVFAQSDSDRPTVTERYVDGYRVLFVNRHKGNGLHMGVHVPTGSYHDHPVVHAGLAHLWEHVIHRGNKKFPVGMEIMQKVSLRAGGFVNAYTAADRTIIMSMAIRPHSAKVWNIWDPWLVLPPGPKKDFN